jgi:S-adenosylmethionine decarboxylase
MPHMTLDAYGADYATLSDYRATFEFMTSLVRAIDMQLVAGPFCVPYKAEEPIGATYSWFVIIATSHISLHLFPHRGMAMLDVFSCKEFDVETVVQLVERHFHTSDIDFHPVVRRATRSPREASV